SVVDVDAYSADVLDELGEAVGNAGVDVLCSAGFLTLVRLCKLVERLRKVRAVGRDPARCREVVGRTQCGRLELELRPSHHFLASQHESAVFRGVVDRRQHRARETAGRNAARSSAPTLAGAVGMDRYNPELPVAFGYLPRLRGDVRGSAPTED